MPTSQARVDANRKNAQLSSGPKTEEGKQRSRRNGLKHGLTGAGIVLADQVAEQVERRHEELRSELAPASAIGKILVLELATLSIRMERSAKQESQAIATNVRNAVEAFDQARLDQAEHLFDILGEEPRVHLRKLKRSPEGVDRLIEGWNDLLEALTRDPKPLWTAWHLEVASNLTGRRIDEATHSRITALSKAVWGDFGSLGAGEGAGLEEEKRQAWARARLVERIEAEILELEDHYETLDFETLDQDRAGAPDRALFDGSKEACLARRYEGESSRRFHKALKELRRVEAEAEANPPRPKPPELRPPLGSSWDRPSPGPREAQPTPAITRPTSNRAVEVVGSMGKGPFEAG